MFIPFLIGTAAAIMLVQFGAISVKQYWLGPAFKTSLLAIVLLTLALFWQGHNRTS